MGNYSSLAGPRVVTPPLAVEPLLGLATADEPQQEREQDGDANATSQTGQHDHGHLRFGAVPRLRFRAGTSTRTMSQ